MRAFLRMAVLAVLTLCLCHAVVLAGWEGAWRVGDAWIYRVESLEFRGPYTRLPFRGDYPLTIAVVGGATADPWGMGVPVWAWTLQIEHEKYGFPVSAEETLYLAEGTAAVRWPLPTLLRWPLPTLFLWYDAFYRPEEGAARVGIPWCGPGPAVWEWPTPVESGGAPMGEVVYRIVIEFIGMGTVEVAGSLVEATQFRYRAETRMLTGARPWLRVHSGTAWGSSAVRNWIKAEGREEVDDRVLREYRLELISFSPGSEE